tara:strand:- start:9313 stop:9573 length:261 start_codon:yes stop_codon:yes gene_type:complete
MMCYLRRARETQTFLVTISAAVKISTIKGPGFSSIFSIAEKRIPVEQLFSSAIDLSSLSLRDATWKIRLGSKVFECRIPHRTIALN